jgi:hypothetical protein
MRSTTTTPAPAAQPVAIEVPEQIAPTTMPVPEQVPATTVTPTTEPVGVPASETAPKRAAKDGD